MEISIIISGDAYLDKTLQYNRYRRRYCSSQSSFHQLVSVG
nr:MAG TPA: hypothetical protein [Caudoviricetes sp.]